jgi:hypothetical protein
MAQENPIRKVYPHPYIMDIKKIEEKLAYVTLQHSERLKDMIREFVRYHAFCSDVTELLNCNIELIALGINPHSYPNIKVPQDCPPPHPPWESESI